MRNSNSTKVNEYYSVKELRNKIFANSFWPVYTPTVFYFYQPGDAEKMTKAGRKALREVIKHFDCVKIEATNK